MRRLVQLCALAALVAVSGCTGGASSPTSSTPQPIATSPSPSPTLTPSLSPSPSESPSSTPSVAALPTASAQAAGACTTAVLRVNVPPGQGAMGTYYTNVVFTNAGAAPCSLLGFPGISFLDPRGSQVGLPAQRVRDKPAHRVVLAVGAKAHAFLGVPETSFYSDSQCHPVHATGIRVYPPNQTKSIVVPVKIDVCAKHSAGRPSVYAIKPGTRG